jgi:hypothetical protein
MIKRDIRIKGLTKAIVALISWGSICTAAHSSLQTDIERALTEEGLTGIAFSPAIPHQRFVCFGVMNPLSVFPNRQHPHLYV